MTTPDDPTLDLSCAEFVEIVTAYLDGELPEVDRRRFEAHLQTCEGCTTFLDQIKETVSLVGRLEETALSPEAESALLGEFRNWKRGG